MTNIKSITPVGKHQTFDLEVEHPDHQFYLANGMLTSNSHAVAYAIDSFWCAWLMTYHEEQWITAYIESMSNSPDKKAKAFSEVKQLGYTIVPIDINEAGLGWTVLPGKRLMPSLLSCKGIGQTAAEEIVSSRPYASIEDVLWNEDGSWRPSKFNRKALEVLIKIRAFDSLGCVGPDKVFKSYRHMHETLMGSYTEEVPRRKGSDETVERIRDHATLIKRTSKKDPHEGRKNFYALARALAEEFEEEWTRRELAEHKIEAFGSFDVLTMVEPELIDRLLEKGVRSVDDWDKRDIYWFVIMEAKPKKTKNGKQYLLLTVQGPEGRTYRMNAWGWDGIREFPAYALVLGEVDRNDYGFSTTMWRVKEIT